MRLLVAGLAVAAAALIGAGPALTENVFHSRWGDTSTQTAVNAADVTDLNAADTTPPAKPDRFANLLRIDANPAVTVAPTISRSVTSSQTIRKVGYGHVTTVNVVTTASGTYSSDGIDSSHVLYPGIETNSAARKGVATLFALLGGNWTALTLGTAGSFTEYGSGYGTSYRTNGQTTCISGKGYYGCM